MNFELGNPLNTAMTQLHQVTSWELNFCKSQVFRCKIIISILFSILT